MKIDLMALAKKADETYLDAGDDGTIFKVAGESFRDTD